MEVVPAETEETEKTEETEETEETEKTKKALQRYLTAKRVRALQKGYGLLDERERRWLYFAVWLLDKRPETLYEKMYLRPQPSFVWKPQRWVHNDTSIDWGQVFPSFSFWRLVFDCLIEHPGKPVEDGPVIL